MEDEHRKIWNKGKALSEEHKRRISISCKGRTLSEETKKRLSIAKTGKSLLLDVNSSKWKLGRFGERCNSWKGGTTKLDKLIRESLNYKNWVSSCMTRDNWTCRTCNKRGIELQVHHLRPLSILIKDNHIMTIQDALNCDNLWDINNGVSLCLECHKQTDTYCGKMFKKLKGGCNG
jgi:hypothetical protein